MNFALFFEGSQKPYTSGILSWAMGIDIHNSYVDSLKNEQVIFPDKMQVRVEGVDDQRKVPIIQELVRKCVSAALRTLNYNDSGKGYLFPKTIFTISFGDLDTEGATHFKRAAQPVGTHRHNRRRSWSHKIDISMKHINSFESFIEFLLHELVHSLQTTQRRITTDKNMKFKWDGKDVDTEIEYEDLPWEIHARRHTELNKPYLQNYLLTGLHKKG